MPENIYNTNQNYVYICVCGRVSGQLSDDLNFKYILKVVCNEMEGGWDTCLFNPYWYGTRVIVVGLNFNGDVVF